MPNRSCKHGRLAAAVSCVALILAAAAAAQEASAPAVRVSAPPLPANAPLESAPTVTFAITGTDADGAGGLPLKWRMLFGRAETGEPGSAVPLATRAEFEAHIDELVAWDDSAWTGWMDYADDPDLMRVTFPGLQADRYYFYAVQVLDADGGVSTGRGYQREVAHIHVTADLHAPAVTLTEWYLGSSTVPQTASSIAPTQPLNFRWTAHADAYGGTIASYRYGWDLIDPGDPNDPGWEVPPGGHLSAPRRAFSDGLHVFTLRVVDDSGQVSLRQWSLAVVPFVDYALQLELLLIDQTVDANVQNWQSRTGEPLNDESYRNAYWHFLAEGSGGVAGFAWDRDRIDHRDQVEYADLVAYKSVLCYAEANQAQLMFDQLRPEDSVDRYVWLAPYRLRGGNLMLVGARSMESFLETLPNYMAPLVFDTPEELAIYGTTTYVVGFGTATLPDGSEVVRGPTMDPFATAGLATLDWTSSNTKYVYGRPFRTASQERRVDCVGLKALVLDGAFRSRWGVSPAAIADTVRTEAAIDWQDAYYAEGDTLDLITNTFPFSYDEFVDANISARTTAWQPQECAVSPGAPDGLCVEPMLRGVARFDWLREYKRAGGDADWPEGTYTGPDLEDMCGPVALEPNGGLPLASARTNGQVYGWLSYKAAGDKPRPSPDVYWGFDPYRFDHVQSKQMVRWVLQEVFGLIVNP